MPVSQQETALSRGRIPSYLRRQYHQLIALLLDRRARRSRMLSHICYFCPQLLPVVMQYSSHRSTSHLLHSLFMSLYHHYYSYDMYIRPTVLFDQLPLEDPIAELQPTEFYELCGFWPGQFREVVDSLSLLPDTITCPITRCAASKDIAIFLLLRRWKKADKWEDVSRVMRRGRVWCIKIYRSVFSLLSQHYRRLVQVLDYRRIIPLLEEWSDSMVHNTGCSPDVLFFSDGKPWKMAKPGNGDAADALIRAAGGDQVNLIQQAFYNGHYGFAGAKVQHILQADGICYSFTCPLRRHDAMVLQESSMLTMLSVLYVNNNPTRPAKCVTDKAYGRTQHLRPLHTSLELRLMNNVDRDAAEAEDARNKGPRNGVEMSFNNIIRKFTHTDYFPNHRILQSGRSNWPYLRQLWDLQVLFFNLFTCAEGMGNPINGMFGIAPPTVAEYLFSANNNLLIPLVPIIDENDNFGPEPQGNRLYYHI
jgi:hypothetical protein